MDKDTVRILLVEDNQAHAELVRRAFEPHAARFCLSVVGSLAEARGWLAQGVTPDLVITDWLLPDGRGSELLPGEDEALPYPVVMMTSHGNEQVAVDAMKAGALDYAVKSAEALADMPHLAERALREWGHIVERKQAQEALQHSQQQLEAFFSQSLDGCFFMMLDEPVRWDDSVDKERVLDYALTHQRITAINDAMLAQYGATRESFLGLTLADLFAHNTPYAKMIWCNFFDAGRLRLETAERKLDGTPMWIEGEYVCLYDQQGRITGHFGIQREITTRKQAEQEREKLITELAEAVATVKTLRGLIPICASCKKIRDDAGYWHQVEVYVRDHSEAEFTHGLCPDCARRLYPEVYAGKDQS